MDGMIKAFKIGTEGWVYIWSIAFMGFICMGFIFERFTYIMRTAAKGRKEFMTNIANFLRAEKPADALNLAKNSPLPIAKCLAAVLENRDQGRAKMEQAYDEVFKTEAPRINRYLTLMMTMANLATLLGLLGTVAGLISSFDAVANVPAAQRPAALANGIALAMNCTFVGLLVAIVMMGMQGWLVMTADRLIEELEEKSTKVINMLA
jgi:biopolymer transport protein ExbB